MKTLLHTFYRMTAGSVPQNLRKHFILLAAVAMPWAAAAADAPRTFASPEEAVTALDAAVKAKDSEALRAIFGSAAKNFENPDRVQATNEFNTFATAMAETNHLVWESPTKVVLEVGNDGWPFPIPMVKQGAQWLFDTQAGKEEILNRRIGKNELRTLEVVRTYVEAQREYASVDRNGDQVLEYAQKLLSSEGLKDGLYWPPELDGEISPFGPLVADAQDQGYSPGRKAGKSAPAPFHGYYFKVLKRQGRNAPGGKYDYVINGRMIAGFALVAWPAEWGQSGVMTFIVNQQGRVYQKDLGPQTSRLAERMKTYDPDPTWHLSPN